MFSLKKLRFLLELIVNVLMCESINELTHFQINEFLYPYLAFRNANTIEVDIAWGLRWFFGPSLMVL